MAKDSRKEYTIPINGIDHTFLLDADDAEAHGFDVSKGKTVEEADVANKARRPANRGRRAAAPAE